MLNALYAAGGPNEVGSYRNIKLLRNGKISKTIDLYEYFVTGTYPNIYLRDQDVILVEAYNKLVDAKNGFKTNALFELNEKETVDDLMKFSGGLSSKSYKNAIYVNRINDYSRSTLEIQKSLKKIYSGNKDAAKAVGVDIAKKLLDKSISSVIFDRGGYVFHGRVQALAQGAREAGLKF